MESRSSRKSMKQIVGWVIECVSGRVSFLTAFVLRSVLAPPRMIVSGRPFLSCMSMENSLGAVILSLKCMKVVN
jgi:hypothetical protein